MSGGRVALVTGGASGFGAEVARQLVRRGDAVVLCDVDDAGGHAVADELGATTDAAQKVRGGLDLVFLNASIMTGYGVSPRPLRRARCG